MKKKMIKNYGKTYIEYRNKSFFILSLPKDYTNLILLPVKLFFLKKRLPEKNIENFFSFNNILYNLNNIYYKYNKQ